jgi:hypothetical protein
MSRGRADGEDLIDARRACGGDGRACSWRAPGPERRVAVPLSRRASSPVGAKTADAEMD